MSVQPTNQDGTPQILEQNDDANESAAEKEFDQAARDIVGKQKDDQLTMFIKVSSPFNIYFEGQAFSISAENDTGLFDILPKHHNFMCLLKPCTVIIRTVKGEEQKIDIGGGLMHVKADKVTVFLDI
ncbi:MAG TPA: hypothetical protein VIH90_05340 [Candidatus Saccharimonadales bacterium]